MDTAYEQCVELPRAIATPDGHPMKGTKSNTIKALEKRYENATPPIIRTALTAGWVPESTIIEGMFLINITPCSAHHNIGEYAEFLLQQHILILGMVQLKCTYFLMIQNAKYKVQNILNGNVETNYILYHLTTTALSSPRTWSFHLNGGKIYSTVENASEV